jgi:glucose-6-phosphate-specific signal transduction histidine kinase
MVAIPLGMTALAAVLFNCGLLKFRVQDRLLALASALMMLGYVLFSQNEDNHFEYPLLLAGVVLFGVLLASQIKRKKMATLALDAALLASGSAPLVEVRR